MGYDCAGAPISGRWRLINLRVVERILRGAIQPVPYMGLAPWRRRRRELRQLLPCQFMLLEGCGMQGEGDTHAHRKKIKKKKHNDNGSEDPAPIPIPSATSYTSVVITVVVGARWARKTVFAAGRWPGLEMAPCRSSVCGRRLMVSGNAMDSRWLWVVFIVIVFCMMTIAPICKSDVWDWVHLEIARWANGFAMSRVGLSNDIMPLVSRPRGRWWMASGGRLRKKRREMSVCTRDEMEEAKADEGGWLRLSYKRNLLRAPLRHCPTSGLEHKGMQQGSPVLEKPDAG